MIVTGVGLLAGGAVSHLAPVYVGVVLAAVALALARPYLCDTCEEASHSSVASQTQAGE
jgi:hypothetical protein